MTSYSKQQKRALLLAARSNGIVDTFRIAGATGGSLHKRGLFYRHFVDTDYGSTITYELSDAGWRLVRELEAQAPATAPGVTDSEEG